jgi:hypothetical protein
VGFTIYDSLGRKVIDPNKTGKSKIKIESFNGWELSKKIGRMMKKTRVIDRVNDRYQEEVIDPETGNSIHCCNEPLSKHEKHGSAKYLKKPPRNIL